MQFRLVFVGIKVLAMVKEGWSLPVSFAGTLAWVGPDFELPRPHQDSVFKVTGHGLID